MGAPMGRALHAAGMQVTGFDIRTDGDFGSLTMNFDPVFSSESLSGRNLQITLMESSVGSSFSSLFLSPIVEERDHSTVNGERARALGVPRVLY